MFMPHLPILLLFLSTILLTGCFSWFFGGEKQTPDPPTPIEVQGKIASASKSSVAVQQSSRSSQTISQKSQESSAVIDEIGHAILTEEEEVFVSDTTEWKKELRYFMQSISKMYAASRGAPVDPETNETELKSRYEKFHAMTEEISIPDQHSEARVLIRQFDSKIGDAVSLLSSPPSNEDLKRANDLLSGLRDQTNELNRFLNDLKY